MLVLFNNEVHWVMDSYTLVQPKEENSSTTNKGKGKKRKQPLEIEEIYLIVNCDDSYSMRRQFAVNSIHCTKIETNMDSDVANCIQTLLENNMSSNSRSLDIYWKCSYQTNSKNSYYIYTIDKIMEDGMIINEFRGDTRHFKFEKLYNACGDGLKYD
jgi:hypothetical protein